ERDHGQNGELQKPRAVEARQLRAVESRQFFLAHGQQAGQPEFRPALQIDVHIHRLDEIRFLERGHHRADHGGALVDELQYTAYVLEVRRITTLREKDWLALGAADAGMIQVDIDHRLPGFAAAL